MTSNAVQLSAPSFRRVHISGNPRRSASRTRGVRERSENASSSSMKLLPIPHDPRELRCVCVLLEADDLSIAKRPDVGKLSIERFAGRLVRRGVAAERDDDIAAVDDLSDVDAEIVPVPSDPHENTVKHGLRPAVRVPIGVGDALRFVPDDPRVETPKDGRDIATRKGLINRTYTLRISRSRRRWTGSRTSKEHRRQEQQQESVSQRHLLG